MCIHVHIQDVCVRSIRNTNVFHICNLDLKDIQRSMCWRFVSQKAFLEGSDEGLMGGLFAIGLEDLRSFLNYSKTT